MKDDTTLLYPGWAECSHNTAKINISRLHIKDNDKYTNNSFEQHVQYRPKNSLEGVLDLKWI